MAVINDTKSTGQLFLLKILDKQKADKLSDYTFAGRLGIDRTTWVHTRRGRRNIGLTLLKAIARTYPDMHQDIINFLKDGRGERL